MVGRKESQEMFVYIYLKRLKENVTREQDDVRILTK